MSADDKAEIVETEIPTADVYQIRVVDGIVVGRARSNIAQPDCETVDLETYEAVADRIGRCRYEDGALSDYAPPAPPQAAPATVADYQFSGQAAAEGIITFAEAMAWTARGEIPPVLLDAVNQAVSDEERRGTVMLFLAGAKEYPRHHALTPILGPLLGKNDDAALDAFWIAAAAR